MRCLMSSSNCIGDCRRRLGCSLLSIAGSSLGLADLRVDYLALHWQVLTQLLPNALTSSRESLILTTESGDNADVVGHLLNGLTSIISSRRTAIVGDQSLHIREA